MFVSYKSIGTKDIELTHMEYELHLASDRHISPMPPSFHSGPNVEAGSTTKPRRRPRDPVKVSNDHGYPKLANLMGNYPDHAIFRRFGRLSTLNIMRLQAELVYLEAELKSCQRKYGGDYWDGARQTSSTSFEFLSQYCPEQLDIMKRSSKVLQEYSKDSP